MPTTADAAKRVTVIVPSYDPDEKLGSVIRDLEDSGFDDIILVNDGSHENCLKYFPSPADHPALTLLTHEVNRGKGAALKTAFEWFLKNRPGREGVVTADGDAQHRVCDILGCAEDMLASGELVLGVRDFSRPDVPPRSRMGNRITSTVFLVLCGLRVSDTQTGLRAFPAATLPDLCRVSGDRYEYETNMLLALKGFGIKYRERKIETVYIEENQTSHFRPVRDSLRIYALILKFLLSSGAATIIDLLLFYLLYKFLPLTGFKVAWLTLEATVAARICSSLVNFAINRGVVFKSDGNIWLSLLKYYAVAIPIMLCSAGGVTLIGYLLGANAPIGRTIFKMIVDTLLYFVGFRLQREWVFDQRSQVRR